MPYPTSIFHDGRHYRAVTSDLSSARPDGGRKFVCFDGGSEHVAWADGAGVVRLAVDASGTEIRLGAQVEITDTGERGKVEAVQGAYVVVQLASGESWRGRAADTKVERAQFSIKAGDTVRDSAGARLRVIEVQGDMLLVKNERDEQARTVEVVGSDGRAVVYVTDGGAIKTSS